MANITECDSCHSRIGNGPGELPPGMEGHTAGAYGLPPGPFHWCQGCAAIASKAVYAIKASDAQDEVSRIRDMIAEAQEHPGRIVTR